MNNVMLTAGNIEIEKRTFHYSKYLINVNNVDIDKIIISDKISFGIKGLKNFYWIQRL